MSDDVTNRFQSLIHGLAQGIERDYAEAQAAARAKNAQKAGHQGESTWQRLLDQWGPGWPVVTRKYVVGPGGTSNEVDVLLLKPDYPVSLQREASILVTGVAAAFSSKLTLRRQHLAEALREKKCLLDVAGGSSGTLRDALAGPFPFGLLAHSQAICGGGEFTDRAGLLYEEVAHEAPGGLATSPREELDCLLVADRGFFSTMRSSLTPRQPHGSLTSWRPMSSFQSHLSNDEQLGTPLAQFITWLGRTTSGPGGGSFAALEALLAANGSRGWMKPWPMEIYPEHLRDDLSALLDNRGHPVHF